MTLYWSDGKRKINTINISQYWPQSIFQLLDVDFQWIKDRYLMQYDDITHKWKSIPQWAGSGLDADMLDWKQATDFANASHTHKNLI